MNFPDIVLAEIAAAIQSKERAPVIVGIDGQGGSGKSTLARELASYLPMNVEVVEGDDFYSDIPENVRVTFGAKEGYERYFDWRRLKKEVIESAINNDKSLRYQRYDWDNAMMGRWVTVPMPDVVIVEGIYALRPQLRNLFDLAVFVKTSEETRLQRQVERGENSSDWIRRWIAAEDFYISEVMPERDVDLVVFGD